MHAKTEYSAGTNTLKFTLETAKLYKETATMLSKKVAVQTILSSAFVQSLTRASLIGLRIKYAAISVNKNTKDNRHAANSLVLILTSLATH